MNLTMWNSAEQAGATHPTQPGAKQQSSADMAVPKTKKQKAQESQNEDDETGNPKSNPNVYLI
jgi:hypothetical protein